MSKHDQLVEIARYATSAEAVLARNELEGAGIKASLAGEATADALSIYGPTIAGVSLVVRRQDADRAQEVLEAVLETTAEGVEADFWDQADGVEELVAEERKVIENAWRAAIIGTVICPPLLNLYSTALIFGHGLLNAKQENWRVPAALVTNFVVFLIVIYLAAVIFRLF